MSKKEKIELIESFKQLAIRKVLAGYDCLENRNQKPYQWLLRKTDYYWEAVGIMQCMCMLVDDGVWKTLDKFQKEIDETTLESVKKYGCKAAYQAFIGNEPNDYCKTYNELMETGIVPSPHPTHKSIELFGYKITKI